MAYCANPACGDELPEDAPHWQTLCRSCYIRARREQEQSAQEALLARALTAERKVELAKKLVLELQAKLRAAEGALRASQGKVGLGHGQAGNDAPGGLDVATLKRIRRLVHPDRHGGSSESVEVAQIIAQLIERSG